MRTYFITRLGSNNGKPRIWLQGARLDDAGFQTACRYTVTVDREAKRVSLKLAMNGERQVSRKEQSGKTVPLVELTKADVLSVFAGIERLRVIFEEGVVHILPLASEARKQARVTRLREKLAAGAALDVGSVSTGVGALALAMHKGMAAGGIATRLAFACDIEQAYLEQCEAKNPVWSRDTMMIAAPMQELAFDQWALRRLSCDILEAGIPCTAHSVAGRAKKGTAKPEDDAQVGHLVVALLSIIAASNPAAIVVENVEQYLSSASFAILKNQLVEWGYDVHTDILRGAEFNVLEHRDRMGLVAVTQGIPFDFANILRPAPEERTLAEVLDDIPDDSPLYSEMAGLKAKEARDLEAGKNFRMQVFTPASRFIGTITRGYAKVRSTDPKIQHPTNPDLLRQITPEEHARLKGFSPELVSGVSKTIAHEMLGQSVLMAPFMATGHALAVAILQWFDTQESLAANDRFELLAA